MAFPTPGAKSKGNTVVNALFTDITLPSPIATGDRVQVWFSPDQNVVSTWPSGWIQVFSVTNGSFVRHECYYRDWEGDETDDEGGDGVIRISHNSNMGSWVAEVVAQAGTFDPATPPASTAAATATSLNPNSLSLNPLGWDVEDTAFRTSCGWDVGTTALSTYPSGYTAVDTDNGAASQSTGTAVAYKNSAAASEDPGSFTLAGATGRPWVAVTTATRPATVTHQTLTAGGNTITFSAPVATLVAGAATVAAGGDTVTFSAPTVGVVTAVTLLAGENVVTFSAPTALLVIASGLLAGGNIIEFTAPTAALVAGAVTLLAGGNTVTITAPDATLSISGASLVGGNTIEVSAPTATLVAGTVTLPAGANTVTVSAPTVALMSTVSLLSGGNDIILSAPAVAFSAGAVVLAAGGNTIVFTAPSATIDDGTEPEPAVDEDKLTGVALLTKPALVS